ncbi:META domain-containing protein [Streptomyces malaysiense]|uniref:META domain-containing protein n=1 Tax=Streptomyces malaysiense TaxID=1428626 RepID=A0A1J4PWI2_9ACTN|nr:META domain-containing protein [Streptomyces malaysiense]OIK24470.1 META domain-containing protein [Streptomyces malaysiense]
MKRNKAPAALALCLPLAVACGATPAHSGAVTVDEPLTGVEWRVVSVTAQGATHPAPASARLLVRDDGTAAGNLGCNGFSAPAALHGDRVTFGRLRTTRMVCDDARMAFERLLGGLLGGGTFTGVADHGELTLTTSHGDHVNLTHSTPE